MARSSELPLDPASADRVRDEASSASTLLASDRLRSDGPVAAVRRRGGDAKMDVVFEPSDTDQRNE